MLKKRNWALVLGLLLLLCGVIFSLRLGSGLNLYRYTPSVRYDQTKGGLQREVSDALDGGTQGFRKGQGNIQNVVRQNSRSGKIEDDARSLAETCFEKRFQKFVSERGRAPQTIAQDHLSSSDLPTLYGMIREQPNAESCASVLMAICILEEDKEKALRTVVGCVRKPIDWDAIRGEEWRFYDAQEKFRNIFVLGYLSSKEASDYLMRLLDEEESRKTVLDSAGTLPQWVHKYFPSSERKVFELNGACENPYWVEQSVRLLQTGAAYGLLLTQDDRLFVSVEREYDVALEKFKANKRISEETWAFTLQNIIGRYRFFKDKGWEEGFAIMGTLEWDEKELYYEQYYPQWTN